MVFLIFKVQQDNAQSKALCLPLLQASAVQICAGPKCSKRAKRQYRERRIHTSAAKGDRAVEGAAAQLVI